MRFTSLPGSDHHVVREVDGDGEHQQRAQAQTGDQRDETRRSARATRPRARARRSPIPSHNMRTNAAIRNAASVSCIHPRRECGHVRAQRGARLCGPYHAFAAVEPLRQRALAVTGRCDAFLAADDRPQPIGRRNAVQSKHQPPPERARRHGPDQLQIASARRVVAPEDAREADRATLDAAAEWSALVDNVMLGDVVAHLREPQARAVKTRHCRESPPMRQTAGMARATPGWPAPRRVRTAWRPPRLRTPARPQRAAAAASPPRWGSRSR